MRGLFVTGTDTGVGKSVLSAALLGAMAAAGEPVRAHKPVLTGLAEPATGDWPADHKLLGAMAHMEPEEVAPFRLAVPASPHLAASLEGLELLPAELLANARAAAVGPSGEARTLLLEGVGGLLVPLAPRYAIADLAADLGLALVIVARPGLGTINHTLLTLEAARSRGLHVAAVVLNPWPPEPGVLEHSNRETIAELGLIDVLTLPELAGPERAALAAAGERLPWREWLEQSDGAADL
jgi:dethiobiotin synthetase